MPDEPTSRNDDASLHRYGRATSGTRGNERGPDPPPVRHNLPIDAELDSLKKERARLIKECEAAGIDPTFHAVPVVRALHPSAVVVPTLLAVCASCVRLERVLRDAQAARARIEHKYTIMQARYNEMHKTQMAYRSKIDRLQANVTAAHERLTRAGLPILGPVHTPKTEGGPP